MVGGCQIKRHLEHRIDTQARGVIAVLIARSNHHQPEADNIRKAVRNVFGRAWILDAGRQATGNPKAPFDLAQQQDAAVRRQQTAIKSDIQTLARNR